MNFRFPLTLAAMFGALLAPAGAAIASDHLDTRTVIADPRADIGDLYAWMSKDGRRLNLVMTIVGHSFSPDLFYAFHVDSGAKFGGTSKSTTIECRFENNTLAECRLGYVDRFYGNAQVPGGGEARNGHFKVFAGLRDDPFYNNVRGSRDAYQVAARALKAGAPFDAANCPAFSSAVAAEILGRWRHADGGPAKNFLAGWTPASLIVSVEVDEVAIGGPLLAVWATTSQVHGERQVDRMGRPLTGNALLAPLAPDEVSDALKERYNAAAPSDWPSFAGAIKQTLGLYDSFDGNCGNQLLADIKAKPQKRYDALARLLADDRLWIDSRATTCSRFFAVELAHLGSGPASAPDCGGRTPTEDAVDVYRSLLATGQVTGVTDGVDRDEEEHSNDVFPFLAPAKAPRP
jgi:hypothetical protein